MRPDGFHTCLVLLMIINISYHLISDHDFEKIYIYISKMDSYYVIYIMYDVINISITFSTQHLTK